MRHLDRWHHQLGCPGARSQQSGYNPAQPPIRPVTETDPASTNYALQSWCIDEQPTLWAAFANFENSQAGQSVVISATSPESEWPLLQNGLAADSTASVAAAVSTNAGAIGAVQTQYATNLGFDTGDPAKGVASEQNASGDYAQPTPVDVESALAYATQRPNGTAELNFNGLGPLVYNPSTYSYLLSPSTGWSPAKGAVMSAFLNYTLTLGQELAPSLGYANLGHSLEQFGINEVQNDVPGVVALTSAEQAALACGGLTPAEVAAGDTTPSAPHPPWTWSRPHYRARPLVSPTRRG